MSIELNGLEKINDRLKEVAEKTGNLRPILAEVGNLLKNEIEDSFERGASPFGQSSLSISVSIFIKMLFYIL